MSKAVFLALLFCALSPAETLRVLTFNVRYPNPDDGANVWTARRDLFVQTVKDQAPDVMGTQELFYIQGQYIVEKLPAYAWFGVSRRGNHEDEHMGVFYRKDRLRLLDSGDFWLSTTPERPGSSSWNMNLPRMATWGLFETIPNGKKFLLLNTHFPHRSQDDAARTKCARLLAARIGLYDEDLPIVLTGDFNAAPTSGAHQVLEPLMKDAWAETHPGQSAGTFHGFRGKPGPDRIDWIFYRAPWKVKEAAIVTTHDGALYPSDHFPVLAVFDLP